MPRHLPIIGIVFLALTIVIPGSWTDQLVQKVKTRCNMNNSADSLINRKPAVAGAFYPASASELIDSLRRMFSSALTSEGYENIQAIICPHAGYIYSGIVAASGYKQLSTHKIFENVFIIGSSHRASYDYATIYTEGNYITPLGEAIVNRDLGKKLCEENPGIFKSIPDPQLKEHCIEVQIPFLQYLYKEKLRIIPILLGTQDYSVCENIARALKPYFTSSNLFIISSDFSHYPNYNDACRVDEETASSILKNSTSEFIEMLNKHEQAHYQELLTSACGWTSILTLLQMTSGNTKYQYHKIQYMNSGDTPSGDKSRVVGYNSLIVTYGTKPNEAHNSKFKLTEEDQSQLLKISRSAIASYLETGKVSTYSPEELSNSVTAKAGVFVTIRKSGELRGCVGSFNASFPLYKLVSEMSIAAATKDTRFTPVSKKELSLITIEISVLTPLHRINTIEEIVLGQDGIYIKKGSSAGTFLPEVAAESGWNLMEFISHCSHDKAGLGWDGWRDAEIYTYQAFAFSENAK